MYTSTQDTKERRYLMVSINKNSSKPYYEQLMLSIKEDIIKGLLQPGDRLPSVREMAQQLTMNPNTISKAYKLLEAQEVILTIKGKGTYVKKTEELLRDEQQIRKIKQTFTDLIIEAIYLSISKEEMNEWLDQCYQQTKEESLDAD